MAKTKHEIANDYVYKATMALLDAITEDLKELTKEKKEVVIHVSYYEFEEVWLASINDNKPVITNEWGMEYELDEVPIQTLINISNALLCNNYHY